MGYDVHITRRQDWWDDEGEDIGAAAWEAVVAADPELVMLPTPEEWRGDVEWVPEAGPGGRGSPLLREALWWSAGRISAKHPGDELLAKMCRLARALDARVQGDDGEYYDT
ncbi:hypothetical protein [Kitasatospora sp. NBC_00458]|uniref:hypothetical protein n=1 Tax=Kitasatospora sp. NBC_00458 TaxID=2903568 RepID=UPI002E16CA3E